MNKACYVLVILIAVSIMPALTIDNYSKTFYDASRDRQVNTEIFYPNDPDYPDAEYPYIIFGHGWLMSYSYTQTLTNILVNLGWIVALPTTEGSLFPNHQNFALDIRYLRGAVLAENDNPDSPLHHKVLPVAIASGYSMGGGAAVLAASGNSEFVGVLTVAAANTNPSAITAASGVTITSVTLSGSDDNIAPPVNHQIPIYNNLSSDYKVYISINDLGHTDVFSSPLIPLLISPWLEYVKTSALVCLDDLEAALDANASSITYQLQNNLVIIPGVPSFVAILPGSQSLVISWDRVGQVEGYGVFASDHPYGGFSDVTSEGILTYGDRIKWTLATPTAGHRFFYVKSYR